LLVGEDEGRMLRRLWLRGCSSGCAIVRTAAQTLALAAAMVCAIAVADWLVPGAAPRALAQAPSQGGGAIAALVPSSAKAHSLPPVRIAVMLSTDKPPSSGPEETFAIQDFVSRRIELINEAGGVAGRRLEAVFLDDRSDAERTKANVDLALSDESVVAMLGIWSSTRGAGVIERIGRSGLPMISEMSVETLFSAYPNIYTLTRSVADEQEVFKVFARDSYRRVAFVGDPDDLYTRAYHGHLVAPGYDIGLAPEIWLRGNIEDQLEAVDKAVEEIKAGGSDLVFLSVGSKRGAAFLARMTAAGVTLPVFIALGSTSGLMADASGAGRAYAGPLVEVAEGGIANLNNERLEQLMRRPDMLTGDKRYSPYATGYGARYADLVALLAEAAAGAKPAGGAAAAAAEPTAIRAEIARRLAGLVEGRRVWRGWAQDWSFSKERASSERSLIVWRPDGAPVTMLAPIQFIRSAGRVARVPVLNVHLDMTRVYQVDSASKSFEAEFFFTMRSAADVPISAIEFTNAVRGPGNAAPLISMREVHADRGNGLLDGSLRIYKISGRFMFEPDLRKYPFDEQVFSISFQPASTAAAFLLQPPSEIVRNQSFSVDGWRVRSQYVGSNDLIIRSIGGMLNEERVIPYYNFNYTWVMKRQVIDYVLRVIVPLSFIMAVAYIAIFIPRSEFEAIIAIQVTSLLSAIALYLALNQPQADDATLSDIIFVVAYASISLMIALSVMEVNTTIAAMPGMMRAIHIVQVYLTPLAVLGLIAFVLISASSSEGFLGGLNQMWKRTAAAAIP